MLPIVIEVSDPTPRTVQVLEASVSAENESVTTAGTATVPPAPPLRLADLEQRQRQRQQQKKPGHGSDSPNQPLSFYQRLLSDLGEANPGVPTSSNEGATGSVIFRSASNLLPLEGLDVEVPSASAINFPPNPRPSLSSNFEQNAKATSSSATTENMMSLTGELPEEPHQPKPPRSDEYEERRLMLQKSLHQQLARTQSLYAAADAHDDGSSNSAARLDRRRTRSEKLVPVKNAEGRVEHQISGTLSAGCVTRRNLEKTESESRAESMSLDHNQYRHSYHHQRVDTGGTDSFLRFDITNSETNVSKIAPRKKCAKRNLTYISNERLDLQGNSRETLETKLKDYLRKTNTRNSVGASLSQLGLPTQV